MLDERKKQIFFAITETYIKTGEPVGSKALAEYFDNAVSSATIRNEMAALTALGLIEQPHTSAGRVPTFFGFRYYIDNLMTKKELSQKEKDEVDYLFKYRDPDPEKLILEASGALADMTNCAVVSTTLPTDTKKILKVELIRASEDMFVVVLITSAKEAKSRVCTVDFEISEEAALVFMNAVNSAIVGKTPDSINVSFIQSLAVAMGEHGIALSPLLFSLLELCKEVYQDRVYLDGQANLLSHGSLKAEGASLLKFLQSENGLLDLIASAGPGTTKIIIGPELMGSEHSLLSLILTKYNIGYSEGNFGLIGPMRLDYSRLVPTLEYFARSLSGFLNESSMNGGTK